MALVSAQKRTSQPFNYIRFALRMRIPLAVAAMGMAVVGLAANHLGIDLMLRPLADRSATHPITALCLFGLGLGAFRMRRFGATPVWRHILGAAIIGICATRLMQAGLTSLTGAPEMAVFGPVAGFSGRFSIESAIILGCFTLAATLRQAAGRWGVVFLFMGLATVSNTLLELSYGLTFFNGDVGAFSLLGMCAVAGAMMTLYIHRPFLRVTFLQGNIGSQTRIMALAAIAIPWVCGFFLFRVSDLSGELAVLEAAMTTVITWSMLLILLASASRLESTDVARRRAEREVAMLSRIDPLTKTLNRFGISEMLEGAWVKFKSSGGHFGVLLLDVEYFRRINETFGGHASGDVLERVAATIQPQLRDHDALGRWSAEEFLILLQVKSHGDLEMVATRLRHALQDVNSPFSAGLDGEPMNIAASLGISDMRETDDSPSDMVTRADTALHFAKEAGDLQTGLQMDLGENNEAMAFKDTVAEDSNGSSDDLNDIAA